MNTCINCGNTIDGGRVYTSRVIDGERVRVEVCFDCYLKEDA